MAERKGNPERKNIIIKSDSYKEFWPNFVAGFGGDFVAAAPVDTPA
jgi:hypothetical protein